MTVTGYLSGSTARRSQCICRAHIPACMSGGDATSMHDGVRDIYLDFCERGGLRPRGEAPGILAEVLGRESRRRPADVLCVPALTLARKLPDGSRAIRTEPVCFDFAIINALGQDHWRDTAEAGGQAAERYAERKRTRNDTARLCLEAGYRFWPVVHEVQGGMAKGADAAVRAIAGAVAEREGRTAAAIREELLGRVAVLIARCTARAIRRRGTPQLRNPPPWWAAAAKVHMENDLELEQ